MNHLPFINATTTFIIPGNCPEKLQLRALFDDQNVLTTSFPANVVSDYWIMTTFCQKRSICMQP